MEAPTKQSRLTLGYAKVDSIPLLFCFTLWIFASMLRVPTLADWLIVWVRESHASFGSPMHVAEAEVWGLGPSCRQVFFRELRGHSPVLAHMFVSRIFLYPWCQQVDALQETFPELECVSVPREWAFCRVQLRPRRCPCPYSVHRLL